MAASRLRVSESRAFPGLPGHATGARADGLRYDGGPEEGTRGVLSSKAELGTRYDGGPEEGSRGGSH